MEEINYKVQGTTEKMGGTIDIGIFPESELVKLKQDKELFNYFDELIILPVDDIEEKPSRVRCIGDSAMNIKAVKNIFTVMRPVRPNSTDLTLFMGNQICANSGFSAYLDFIIYLSTQVNTIFLRGRNEELLIRTIKGEEITPDERYYELIDAIESDIHCDVAEIPELFPEYWDWLKSTQYYYETNSYIFTPCSIKLSSDWKTTTKDYMYGWHKEFLTDKNYTGKTIVFGDYPASGIHNITGGSSNGIRHWYNREENKICLNGLPTEKDGKLLGLFIMDDENSPVSIRTTRRTTEDYFKVQEDMAREKRKAEQREKEQPNGQLSFFFEEFKYDPNEKNFLC